MTREDFEDLCDLAGYGIGYWADSGHVEPDCYTVVESMDGKRIEVPRVRVEQVLSQISAGQWRSELNERVHQSLASGDVGEWDVEDADALIQLCAFGELVYG